MSSPDRSRPDYDDPANRTKLAWSRTAIAFLAIGGATLRSSPVAGAVVLLLSVPVWAVTRRTGRTALDANSTSGPRIVTATIVAVAVAALIVALFARSPDSLGQLLRGY